MKLAIIVVTILILTLAFFIMWVDLIKLFSLKRKKKNRNENKDTRRRGL